MAPTDGKAIFALAQVGAYRIGIPSASVVQVLPRPPRLMQLPRRSKVIEGLLQHGGRLLPVVRIDGWVDMGDAVRREDERILVLRDGGRLIGLLVDTVMGVRRVAADQQLRIHRGEQPDELFQSAVPGQAGESSLSLLEVDRLMALADVWCDEGGVDVASGDEPQADEPPEAVGSKEAWASFRIGQTHAALRAADIGELIPRPPLQHGLPLRSEARGIIRWRGRFVPVVDLAAPLGGLADPADAPWVCVVRRGAHAVGVLVHEVSALLAVDMDTLSIPLRLHGADEGPALLLGAIVSEATRTVQLVSTEGLMRLYPEVVISAGQGEDPEAQDRNAIRCTASAFMVFEAGTPFASPIQAVQEVIALPPALLASMEAGAPTTIDWRGHAVPLIDLRRREDKGSAAEPRQLVIIAEGEQRAAVAIGGVQALIPAKAAKRRRFPGGARGPIEMVMVDTPSQQASYAVLDLKQFVAGDPPAAARPS